MWRSVVFWQPGHLRKAFGNRKCSSGSNLILTRIEEGAKIISLNSLKTRNALSLEMIKALRQELVIDSHIRSVVIGSQGPVFSSGHNLKELTSDLGSENQQNIFLECEKLMLDIVELPVPVITAVDGLAAAAGCQLVAMSDIAVATEKSSFSTPGSNFGLFCSTPGIPLARMVPRKISSYMLLTGKAISCEEALQSGLISKMVADSERLQKEIQEICHAIEAKPRAVVELGKRFYYQQLEMGLSEAMNEGSKVMVKNLGYKDAQEGLNAFKEKRKPLWTHTNDTC